MDTYLKRYLWVVYLLLITAVGHSTSMLANHFIVQEAKSALAQLKPKDAKARRVVPNKTVGESRRWATEITKRNLFNANPPTPEALRQKAEAEAGKEEAPDGKMPEPHEECKPASISATLRLTMIADPVESSYAIIQVNQKDRLFVIGEVIESQEIVAMQWHSTNKRVVLRDRAEYSCLTLGQKSSSKPKPKRAKRRGKRNQRKNDVYKNGIKEVAPGRFEVDRAMLDEQLADLDSIIRQARVIPHYKRGKPAGFKIVGIRSNSIFKHLGLKSGDVLKSVGGEELTSINKAMGLFEQLKTSSNVALEIERRGQRNSYQYDIK